MKPLTLVAIVLLNGCNERSTSFSNEETQIANVRKLSNSAIAKHDTAALALTLTPDYHVVTSRNFEVSGRKANMVRLANEFNEKPDVIYIRTPDKVKVFPAWKMASENGTWVGRWTENGERIELTGTYFAKWHNVNGEWLVRAEVFVP